MRGDKNQLVCEGTRRDGTVAARRPSRQELLGVTVLYGLTLLLLLCVTHRTPVREGRGHDGQHYAAMAGDESLAEPFAPISPYCYRVLTPFLVSLLPGPVVCRFLVFHSVVWWAVLVAWHLLARSTGLGRTHTVFGTLVFATCAWGPMNTLHNPCYVDPLMYLFVIVGLHLMMSGNAWFAVLVPISILQREQTAVVLLVSAIAWEVHRDGWSGVKTLRYGLIVAACAAVYGALHYFITPQGGTAMTPWATAFQVARWLFDDPKYILISCSAVVYALGLPLMGLILMPAARRFLTQNRWPEYFLFLCLLSLFGGSDKGRLVFLAQPVVVLAFVHGIGSLAHKRELGIVLAGLLLVHVYAQFPPSLMTDGGRLIAPLVDTPERGTHAASWILESYWPSSLFGIVLYLMASLGLAGAILWVIDHEQRRSPMTPPTPSPATSGV